MFKSIKEAEAFLGQFISQNAGQMFPGNFGLDRTKYLLNLIKNPQNKLKVIHIAGTSGKSSTAFYTSLVLNSLGFKTGLHISPYLLNFRERFQINNRLISEKLFCQYLNEILPAIKKTQKSKFGNPSYFEILTVLAFHIFWKEKVNYAVIETGLGGLLDATNTVSSKNKLNILTRIGYDHTKILGKTLKEIARQKAGIIQPCTATLSIWQTRKVREIFTKQASKNACSLIYLRKGIDFKNIALKNNRIFFDFSFGKNILKNIELKTNAYFQAENCAMALAAVASLGQRDGFLLHSPKIRKVLKNNFLLGRMDTHKIKEKTVILDGAHNPQKMKIFIESLKKVYPNQKFSFLIAIKNGKDYGMMLNFAIPEAKNIILSTFKITGQDMFHNYEDPKNIGKYLQKNNFLDYEIIPDAKMAFEKLIRNPAHFLIVTGSIYFLNIIYRLLSQRKRNKSNLH